MSHGAAFGSGRSECPLPVDFGPFSSRADVRFGILPASLDVRFTRRLAHNRQYANQVCHFFGVLFSNLE